MSHLGDLMVCQKLCMRCNAWAGALSWWSCQSPVVHSCILLNHLNSFCGGMSKLNVKFDADLLLYLLSHFEYDSHTVYMLTQWHLPLPLTSTVKSSLSMHAHSSPLLLAAKLYQYHSNCSFMLTMAWLFLDRLHILIFLYFISFKIYYSILQFSFSKPFSFTLLLLWIMNMFSTSVVPWPFLLHESFFYHIGLCFLTCFYRWMF